MDSKNSLCVRPSAMKSDLATPVQSVVHAVYPMAAREAGRKTGSIIPSTSILPPEDAIVEVVWMGHGLSRGGAR